MQLARDSRIGKSRAEVEGYSIDGAALEGWFGRMKEGRYRKIRPRVCNKRHGAYEIKRSLTQTEGRAIGSRAYLSRVYNSARAYPAFARVKTSLTKRTPVEN